MSIEAGRAYFRQFGMEDRVQEFTVSSATVDLAAKALGVSVATLQNYESGKTVPQWGTVQKIETVYNFPADFIFLS